MMKMFALWNKRAQLRRELNALSDRELSDIGLHRGMIEQVVKTAQ